MWGVACQEGNITLIWRMNQIRGSIVASISACHAEDPGSIPGRGVLLVASMSACINHAIAIRRGSHSSVGQSVRPITVRSAVQARVGALA